MCNKLEDLIKEVTSGETKKSQVSKCKRNVEWWVRGRQRMYRRRTQFLHFLISTRWRYLCTPSYKYLRRSVHAYVLICCCSPYTSSLVYCPWHQVFFSSTSHTHSQQDIRSTTISYSHRNPDVYGDVTLGSWLSVSRNPFNEAVLLVRYPYHYQYRTLTTLLICFRNSVINVIMDHTRSTYIRVKVFLSLRTLVKKEERGRRFGLLRLPWGPQLTFSCLPFVTRSNDDVGVGSILDD